jgi:segregation and condensation protein B
MGRVLIMNEIGSAIEAILMVSEEPVSAQVFAQILEVPFEEVDRVLREMRSDYLSEGRGFQLNEVAGGWRFYSSPTHAPFVERFVVEGQPAKLTQAALETLAVIAYRQPVSRARVSAIRGVNVEAVMKTLVTRGLVEEVGIEYETGAVLYSTTKLFLERLGLNALADLPPIAPLLPDRDGLDEVIATLTE